MILTKLIIISFFFLYILLNHANNRTLKQYGAVEHTIRMKDNKLLWNQRIWQFLLIIVKITRFGPNLESVNKEDFDGAVQEGCCHQSVIRGELDTEDIVWHLEGPGVNYTQLTAEVEKTS